MRILLIFLIILNLLYAGWVYFSPAPSGQKLSSVVENLKPLELLNEKPETVGIDIENGLVAGVESPDEGVEAEPGTDRVAVEVLSCYTVGPFKDESLMQQLRDSLSQHVSKVSVRKRVETEKHRYWVYLPAASSRKQAKETASRLREKNIKDFYIVLRGDTKHSISLGHFREQKHANRRRKGVAKLGFNAEIDVIYRDYEVYWLDYRLSDPELDPGFKLTEYETEGVSQISRSCDQDGPE